MQSRILILSIFLAVVPRPVLSQQVGGPLTKNQVLDLVGFGMDSAEVAKRINEHGIGFEPNEDYGMPCARRGRRRR
jgi:hypothetical protein